MNFSINGNPHVIGNAKCPECMRYYPKVCGCGGLVHSQFIKEEADHNIISQYMCDKCGNKFWFKSIKPKPEFVKPEKMKRMKR